MAQQMLALAVLVCVAVLAGASHACPGACRMGVQAGASSLYLTAFQEATNGKNSSVGLMYGVTNEEHSLYAQYWQTTSQASGWSWHLFDNTDLEFDNSLQLDLASTPAFLLGVEVADRDGTVRSQGAAQCGSSSCCCSSFTAEIYYCTCNGLGEFVNTSLSPVTFQYLCYSDSEAAVAYVKATIGAVDGSNVPASNNTLAVDPACSPSIAPAVF